METRLNLFVFITLILCFERLYLFPKLLEIYRESESSPEVDREGLATAADEPEASPARKQKWHDRLPLFNLFHRSQAADSSSHELVEILVDPRSATTDVQRSTSNQLSLANDDEVSISVRAVRLIAQKEMLTSICRQPIYMMMV